MTALTSSDLIFTSGPLRHFRFFVADGFYRFVHPAGLEVTVSADVVHEAFAAANADPDADVALSEVIEFLLPPMCQDCGCALQPNEIAVCAACEAIRIEDLATEI